MTRLNQYWIGTGWKMNNTLAESLAYAMTLERNLCNIDQRIQTFVIPPFTSVRQVKKALEHSPVMVGAQNMHWADDGAWTGEISPSMLIDCQLDLVEIGHSERREHFGETNHTVGLKTDAAVRAGLLPLVCIGETREERDKGQSDDILETQVRAAFEHLSPDHKTSTMLLAYEPVWAIGAGGVAASPGYTNARHEHIHAVTRSVLGRDVPCLYGGSVTEENCRDYLQCPDVDGLFIGRAAWDISGYLNILNLSASVL